jgi:hypothetical protein
MMITVPIPGYQLPSSEYHPCSAHPARYPRRDWPTPVLLPADHRVFRRVSGGNPSAHEPWDGAYCTDIHEYRSPADLSPVGRRRLGLQAWCHGRG